MSHSGLPIVAVLVCQRESPQFLPHGIVPWESLHGMLIQQKICDELSQFLFPHPPVRFRRANFRRVFRVQEGAKNEFQPMLFDILWPMIT